MYLWHWPLIVFADRFLSYGTLGIFAKGGVIAVAAVAAYLSWRWVEQPFRAREGAWTYNWSRRKIFGASFAATLAFALLGAFVLLSQGWPSRFPGMESISLERQTALESTDEAWQKFDQARCFVVKASDWIGDSCYLNRDRADASAILWGDSFAWAYAYGFFQNDGLKLGVLQYTSPQCPPILGYHAASRPECGAFNNGIERVAGQYHVSTVIMVADWSAYIRRRKVSYEDVAATVTTLQGSGLRVILVGQSPKFSFAYPDEYFFSKFARTSTAKAYYAPLNADPDINAHISATAHADVF
jgi:hypothetical protein